jgi:hypothetical protein
MFAHICEQTLKRDLIILCGEGGAIIRRYRMFFSSKGAASRARLDLTGTQETVN